MVAAAASGAAVGQITRIEGCRAALFFCDFGEFIGQMSAWIQGGRSGFREDIVDVLENAPQPFIGRLEGRNCGKLIVRVGSD